MLVPPKKGTFFIKNLHCVVFLLYLYRNSWLTLKKVFYGLYKRNNSG